MTDEQIKQGAKCKYHSLCSMYNNSVLSSKIENEMCGIGLPADKSYEPEVPEPDEFVPSSAYAHGAGGICDAFKRYKDFEIISSVIKHLHSMEKIIDNHGYL